MEDDDDRPEASSASTTTTAPSGFTDDGADLGIPDHGSLTPAAESSALPTMHARRSRKPGGGGSNLRKSLAWNQAFLTEEGVLNPTELSFLSGSTSTDALGGFEMSPFRGYSKPSGLRGQIHDLKESTIDRLARTQIGDATAGESHPNKPEASSAALTKIPLARDTSRSAPASPATHSQKRSASITAKLPASKIPKFTPAKSQDSSLPVNPRNSMPSTKSSERGQTNVERSGGLGGISSHLVKSSAHDNEKYIMPQAVKGNTSLKVAADPLFLARSHEPSSVSCSGKIASVLPHSTNRASGIPPPAAIAKPSALRMPSPSMGFFCKGKNYPSYRSQSERPIQPFDSSIPSIRKPINPKSASELRPLLMPTSRQSIKGNAHTTSSAGAITPSSTKNFCVESIMEMKQLDTRGRSNSVTSGRCHPPTNNQEQLNTNCLTVGDNIDKQSSEILLEKLDHDQIRKAPDECNSILETNKIGPVKQFENIHIANPSNGGSNQSIVSRANFSYQQGNDLKQLKVGNFGGDNLTRHSHPANKCDVSNAVPCEGKFAAQSSYSIPDLGSGLAAKDIISSSLPEVESSCRSHKEQTARGASCAKFSSQQGSDCQLLLEDNTGGDSPAKHRYIECTNVDYSVLSECKLAVQNSYCLPNSGSGLITKRLGDGASSEAGSHFTYSNEGKADEISCIDFSSMQRTESKLQEEDNFRGENTAEHPHVRHSGDETCIVPSDGELSAYHPPDYESGLAAETIDSAASMKSESPFRPSKEQITAEISCIDFSSNQRTEFKKQQDNNFSGGNIAENIGNRGDETCTVLSEGQSSALNSCRTPDYESRLAADNIDSVASMKSESPFHSEEQIAASVLGSTLSEGCQGTPSQSRESEVSNHRIDSSSEISSLEVENVLNSDVVQLKSKVNAPPFSDEWVAALESIGEEILQLKTGPVQNSPPDKSLPEPGPWSPVKRKAEEIGPFDCTKYSKNLSASETQ